MAKLKDKPAPHQSDGISENSGLLRSVLDATNYPITVKRAIYNKKGAIEDYEIVMLNRAAMGLIADKDPVGKKYTEIYPHAVESGLMDQYNHVMLSDEPLDIEHSFHLGKQVIFFRIKAKKSNDLLIVSAEDITKQKQAGFEIEDLNKTLLVKNRELEGLTSELQTFTNIAANDYKETLKNLYTNLEFLIGNEAKNLSNSGKANIRKAQNAIQKMKLLTEDIVSFSKIPLLDNEMREVDLNEIVNDVLSDMNEKIVRTNAKIQMETLPVIKGFPLLLSLLFYHLIDNALKFTSKNEAPEITIRYDQKKSSLITPRTLYHRITISDKGIGFEQKLAPKLFEIFYKVHEKSEYRGSGIGLAVCKKIMDQHKGMILAQTHEHKGADFCCFFPVSND